MNTAFRGSFLAYWSAVLLLGAFVCMPHAAQAQKKKIRTLLNAPSIIPVKLDALNSPAREANCAVSPDGTTLYFMSDRGGQPWSRFDESRNRNDGDIFVSRKRDGSWSAPKPLDAVINTEYNEDEPNITPDGQTLIFQSWRGDWQTNGGPYYMAELRGTKWESPTGLAGGMTQFFVDFMRDAGLTEASAMVTDGMSISADGSTVVFAFGTNDQKKQTFDLYVCKKIDGAWGAVQKLPISTPKNERSVFLAPDGKTLYFASNGLGGFGGLDIFKTTLNADGTCGEVVNIGEPFNSAADDYGFIISATGKEAYFVRSGDMYAADMTLASSELKPKAVLMLTGVVTDKATGKFLEAAIEINEVTGDGDGAGPAPTLPYAANGKSNSTNGEYTLLLKPGKKYVQTLLVPKYKNVTREFEVALDERETLVFNVALDPRPPKVPKTPVAANDKTGKNAAATAAVAPTLKPIYFDSDQFILSDESFDELDKVMEFLRGNAGYQLEVFGYADDRGSYEYNMKLSQRRVNEVVEYLLSTGVERKQMVLQWFGEDEPLAPNVSDQNRSKNRRVEVRFFKKADVKPDTKADAVSQPVTPAKNPAKTSAQKPVPSVQSPSALPNADQPKKNDTNAPAKTTPKPSTKNNDIQMREIKQ
jgi:outer membrane protein OmpA-like peptidoglycan-associated protein